MSANNYITMEALYSAPQEVAFYDSFFDEVKSLSLIQEFDSLSTFEASTHIGFHFNLKTNDEMGVFVKSFDSFISDDIMEVTTVVAPTTVDFEAFTSPLMIMDFKNSMRLVSVGNNKVIIFQPPENITYSERLPIARWRMSNIFRQKSFHRNFVSARYGTLFNNANKAGVIGAKVHFGVMVKREGYIAKIKEGKFLNIIKKDIPIRIKGNKYPTIFRVSVVNAPTAKMSFNARAKILENNPPIPFEAVDPVTIDITESVIPLVTLLPPPPLGGYTSPEFKIDIKDINIEPLYWRFGMKKFAHDIGGYLASPFKLISAVSAGGIYQPFEGEALLQEVLRVKVDNYTSSDMVSFDAFLWKWGTHKGTEDIDSLLQPVVTVELPIASIRNYKAYRWEAPIVVETVYDTLPTTDFEAFVGPRFNVDTAERTLDVNTIGLYRDIFVEQSYPGPHANVPWASKMGNMGKLRGKYQDIIGYGVIKRAGYVGRTGYQTMIVDHHNNHLLHAPFMVTPLQLAPYIRISKQNGDFTDFIYISVSGAGGVITHAHISGFAERVGENGAYSTAIREKIVGMDREVKDGDILDSYQLTAAAMTIGSKRYIRHAKIVREYDNGVLWSEEEFNNSLAYLKQEEIMGFVELFRKSPYNPIVLRSILYDRLRGLVNKDMFSPPTVLTHRVLIGYDDQDNPIYDVTPYFSTDVDDIPDGDNIYEMIVSSRDGSIAHATIPLHVGGNFGRMLPLSVPISGGCSIQEQCEVGTVQGMKYARVLKFDEVKPSHAIIDMSIEFGVGNDEVQTLGHSFFGDIDSFMSSKILTVTVKGNIPSIYADGEIICSITYGTLISEYYFESSLSVGLSSIDGITTDNIIELKSTYPQDNLMEAVYAPWKYIIDARIKTVDIGEYYGPQLTATINTGRIDIDGFNSNSGFSETIWLKVFARYDANVSSIEQKILDFHITEQSFDKDFVMEYDYIAPISAGVFAPSKSRDGTIKEKEMQEDASWHEEPSGAGKRGTALCGTFRSTTYLEYQNFHHLFHEHDNYLWGTYGWASKQIYLAGMIRRETREVIRKGFKLSEADSLKRTIYEARLSAIEDLGVVQDWHFEEFTLDLKDFEDTQISAEAYEEIDISFRAALKSVIENIGSDMERAERVGEKDLFPDFPSRPKPNNVLSTTKQVKQFFVVHKVHS